MRRARDMRKQERHKDEMARLRANGAKIEIEIEIEILGRSIELASNGREGKSSARDAHGRGERLGGEHLGARGGGRRRQCILVDGAANAPFGQG